MTEEYAFTSKPTILVVDDDPVLTMLIGGILAKTGKIFTARSGDEGLRLARRENPDLILLDVQMPGQDGFDVISELKMDPALRHIPVIFITGEVLPEIESHCLEAGAADYIAKPVTPRVLQARARTHLLLKQQADMLADLSFLDPLTGAMNTAAFRERIAAECGRAAAHGHALSLLLVDIDRFAAYNETYGYAAGDDALVAVVKATMAQANRPGDVVARPTGERLVVLLPETTAPQAAAIADRICAAVRDRALRHGKSDVADVLTVSIGAATATAPTTDTQLMAAADKALQTAKATGRNRVNASVAL